MKMKKILISTLVLAVIFMLTISVQATDISTTTYTAEADFRDMDPILTHDSPRVETVISCNMVLKPKTKAHLSRLCSSAVSNVIYYFNESEEDIKKGPDYDVVDDEIFYPATKRISNSYIGGKINYKVGCDFQTKWETGEKIHKEIPAKTYQTAVIISSVTAQVDLGVAHTVSVETGDQSQPNWTGTSGVFPGFEGTLVDWTYNFGFIEDSGSGVSNPFRAKSKNVHIINIKGGLFNSSLNDGHIVFGSGSNTTSLNDSLRSLCSSAKKLYIQYNENESACDETGVLTEEGWQEISSENYSKFVKNSDGNISYPPFMNAWIRIYAVTSVPEASDCRPVRRTIVKSRIGTKYPGFEFNNMKEGDVLKIFTVNGKKIREITSGDADGFIWDGKKDNGDWAKSGIYIYQLKHDGSLVSGTIVFVY